MKFELRLIITFVFLLVLCSCGNTVGGVKPDVRKEIDAGNSLSSGPLRDAYRLRVGDEINIVVFGEPELTMDVELNEAGRISYPYLGQLDLLGKTSDEVQVLIAEGLSKGYLIDPRVSVTVEAFREIFIGGEVVQGGNFAFQPGLTVGKAIVLARGFTERAARNRIFVVSEGEDNNKPVRVSMDYVLKPGDVVTIQRRFF